MSQLSRRIASGAILAGAGVLSVASTATAQRAKAPVAAPAAPMAVPVATEFDRLHFRSIGPATMSGRIADVAVYEANPSIYYVGR